jgi:hypothetical protein
MDPNPYLQARDQRVAEVLLHVEELGLNKPPLHCKFRLITKHARCLRATKSLVPASSINLGF